jgi:hypothetical protein
LPLPIGVKDAHRDTRPLRRLGLAIEQAVSVLRYADEHAEGRHLGHLSNQDPRYPLDGVGSRWEAADIRAWITGTDIAADILPEGIVRRKTRYLEVPEESLNALVQYVATLE